jgi:putative ABC transport system permease protein
MNIFESILQAFSTIRENKLRSGLILLSISIGVFAIFGAGTFVTALDNTVANEISDLGENTFQIKRTPSVQMGRRSWMKYRKRPRIQYNDVEKLKSRLTMSQFVSASTDDGGKIVKSRYIASDPNVTLAGVDANYFMNYNYDVEFGRAITEQDVQLKRNVAVVGTDVIKKVFPTLEVLGEKITIDNQQFEIVGILEEKGAVLGQSQDNKVMIPINIYLKYYSDWWESLNITIKAVDKVYFSETVDEAIGAMRILRNLKPWEDNDFEVETNDTIGEQFAGLTGFLTVFGVLIGLFTLIAAGIGITNIMLITVKERTREIGVRMAVGAKRHWILFQFIVETITICQVGGIIGIAFGLIVVSVTSIAFGLSFVVPINWIFYSIIIATVLGMLSGIYPAYRASKLDPIDALRYE